MNRAAADAIAKTVLYEGYVLYPYQPLSPLNSRRWSVGGVHAQGHAAGGSEFRCECLVEGGSKTRIEIAMRFLHLIKRQVFAGGRPVESLEAGGATHRTRDEALEREISLPPVSLGVLCESGTRSHFAFDACEAVETVRDAGTLRGSIRRSRAAIAGHVEAGAVALDRDVYRLCVRVTNDTPAAAPADRTAGTREAQSRALLSAHVLAGVEGGAFSSLIDPPAHLAAAARSCINQGAWPMLVGHECAHDTLLFWPIILFDRPQSAAASREIEMAPAALHE